MIEKPIITPVATATLREDEGVRVSTHRSPQPVMNPVLDRPLQTLSVEPPSAQQVLPAQPATQVQSAPAIQLQSETHAKAALQPRVQMLSAQARMESAFRIPVVATLVFVITMIAIYYLGRTVAGYHAPVVVDGQVEMSARS